jgi:hypothetical protein
MNLSHSIVRVTCLLELPVELAPIGLDMTPMALLGAGGSERAVSSAVSVISAGNGQLNPALASRLRSTRQSTAQHLLGGQNSLSPTPAILKRSTSRTWRILSSLPPSTPHAEAPLNRPRPSRNGGRNHPGTPSEIKSECWVTPSRIRGRLPSEAARRIGIEVNLLVLEASPQTLDRP